MDRGPKEGMLLGKGGDWVNWITALQLQVQCDGGKCTRPTTSQICSPRSRKIL
jgi:hypothetical protein